GASARMTKSASPSTSRPLAPRTSNRTKRGKVDSPIQFGCQVSAPPGARRPNRKLMSHLPSISTTGLSGATSSKLLFGPGQGAAAREGQHDGSIARRRRRDGRRSDKDDLAGLLGAPGLGGERDRRAGFGAARDLPGRAKVGGQPIGREDEALRDIDGSGAAIE